MARKETDSEVLDQMNDEPETMLPTVRGTAELGAVVGDIDPSDLPLPRLQIAYGVGGLSENFNPGDLVLGGDNLIAKKGEPVNIIILSVTQYWKERLTSDAYAAGNRPKAFATEKEVHAVNPETGMPYGTTQWIDGVGPTFNKALNIRMLIEKPANLVCAMFGIPVDGKEYAAAVWDIDKSAYKRVAPTVLQASQFSLRQRGLLSGVFTLSTRSEKIGNNMTVVPVIKLAAHNSDEVVQEIRNLFAKA